MVKKKLGEKHGHLPPKSKPWWLPETQETHWFSPAVLDKVNVGIAEFAQTLLQVLPEASQGHLDDIHVAQQLPV